MLGTPEPRTEAGELERSWFWENLGRKPMPEGSIQRARVRVRATGCHRRPEGRWSPEEGGSEKPGGRRDAQPQW